MELTVTQISNLVKVRAGDKLPRNDLRVQTALAGQRVSWQVVLRTANPMLVTVQAEGDLAERVTLYRVRDVIMDRPVTAENVCPDHYITLEPGTMPDVLVPLDEQGGKLIAGPGGAVLWVEVELPRDVQPGSYTVQLRFSVRTDVRAEILSPMTLRVLPAVMPEQKLLYTRWFYADCVAGVHNVPIFSEEHWALMEKHIAAAARVGINTILVPIHTPPLDTAIGAARPCVQLVNIEKVGSEYRFGFEKFTRFIALCRANGITHFEMAHLFSQWGAKCAPNIMVTHDGVTDYLFGWHTPADGAEYTEFLKQYVAALCRQLEIEGIEENTFFHISDEPALAQLEQYRKAAEMLRPLKGKSRTLDAMSHYEFYEQGLVDCPVSVVDCVHDFMLHEIKDQWVYYCCVPQSGFPNSFLAMRGYNIRVLGFMLYRYDIKGFLHWGLNFYNSQVSAYPIDPAQTTSADGVFPSGDGFILYPGRDTVYGSVRGELTFEAIQDIGICRALEARVGRDEVVSMIDAAAGGVLRFDTYPNNDSFLTGLRSAMLERLSAEIGK